MLARFRNPSHHRHCPHSLGAGGPILHHLAVELRFIGILGVGVGRDLKIPVVAVIGHVELVVVPCVRIPSPSIQRQPHLSGYLRRLMLRIREPPGIHSINQWTDRVRWCGHIHQKRRPSRNRYRGKGDGRARGFRRVRRARSLQVHHRRRRIRGHIQPSATDGSKSSASTVHTIYRPPQC